ncbi:T9SS type A sorting domain-containing protein [archaeon]|nr:MAG: T9SS type A sorting domain-containing protein [archaeon]
MPFLNPFPPCFQPANINVSNINMTGATIRWNSGFNGISYRYAVSTSATPPLTGTTIIDTTFDAINLDPNTKYYVHLRTHCGTTNFSPWVIDSFMTYPTCQPPVTPVVTNVTASSAFVEWNYYPGIMNYEYFINQTATPPSINGYPTNSVAAAPIGLNSGTTYYVHVRTQCDTGIYSPWVTESFTTTILCVPPSVPVITNLGPTFASFSWGAVGAAQNYEHAITQAAQPPVAGTPTTNLNHTSNVLLPNTSYFFHVRAYCSASDISTWQSIPFTTQPLAIGDVDGNSFVVNVFPNPASDLLNIQVEGLIKGKGEVFLYDLSGKLVANMELLTEKNMLRIGQLAPGMYILKYVDSETTGVLRIEKR